MGAGLASVLGLMLGLGNVAGAATPRIVNGLATHDFPTTGALLHNPDGPITPSTAGSWCSGTLIGCSTFLTAAHCVEDSGDEDQYWVYLQHGGIYEVADVIEHPGYDGDSGNDIAILKLATPVEGIDPTAINTTHDLDAMGVGLDGVIAGFGQTSGSGNDYGIKRYGDVVTADCDTAETGGEGNDKLVCWDYASPVGAPGEDSNTCNGDSGGPLFMTFGGSTEVVGVTSAGSAADCLPLDHSWDASVYFNRAYIQAQLGADSTAACGDLPVVGDPEVTITEHSGTLSSANATDSYVVALTGTPSLVRFTFNGEDSGAFKSSLYVKAGNGVAGPGNFDCKVDGGVVFAGCEISDPAPGNWSITVQRSTGTGDYQITTTEFAGEPPVCGDNQATGGEECDGTDLGECAVGPCMACSCPAPVCGNNVVESGEECDGTSDAACDGLCSGCACPSPMCGNDVLESGEECDGDADDACPGACAGDCSCDLGCSTDDLYGLSILSDALRFRYKGYLYDMSANHADLDPRNGVALEITDGNGTVSMAIPGGDLGWIRSRPEVGKFKWKGDGAIDGLTRVKFQRRLGFANDYWQIQIKGRSVPGGGDIDVSEVLDFTLTVDGTCHTETW
ncbi:MAG TPA: trypsin-like serine protease [Candidatus Binatia bacterium]|nr:trypsin-like serine protease [Candidatus Binatia bacterium]